MCISIKFLDKVEGALVVRTVPNLDFGLTALLLDRELGRQSRTLLLTSKLNEHLTVSLTDEHGRDPDSSSCAIVAHDHIGDILNTRVNDDKEAGSGALRIAHLVNKSALTAFSNDDLSREGLLILGRDVLLNLLKLCRIALIAHL